MALLNSLKNEKKRNNFTLAIACAPHKGTVQSVLAQNGHLVTMTVDTVDTWSGRFSDIAFRLCATRARFTVAVRVLGALGRHQNLQNLHTQNLHTVQPGPKRT